MDIIERTRRQTIMHMHGLNVKIGDPWGPWQQEQWEKIQQKLRNEKVNTNSIKNTNNILRYKKYERIISLFFLAPSILCVIFFVLSLFDFHDEIIDLENLRGLWGCGYGDNKFSSSPIFIGLISIAGAYLYRDSIDFDK